jgi:hypothetical protein
MSAAMSRTRCWMSSVEIRTFIRRQLNHDAHDEHETEMDRRDRRVRRG